MHSTEIDNEKKLARIFVLIIATFLFTLLSSCQTTPQWVPYDGVAGKVYPEENWQKAQTPEQLGWSSEKLAEARVYSEKIGSAAVMIVDDGVVVAAWGDVTRKFKCHSMRKSLLSALMGIHVNEGNIDLSKSMEDLGIDDYEPTLTLAEKQATVGDLIKARSGIYHAALGENQMMKDMRPERHSHAPGTFWYYNKWVGPNTGIFPGGESLVFSCSQDGTLTISAGANIKFSGKWWISGDKFYFKILGMKGYFHIIQEGESIKCFDPSGTLFGNFNVARN